MNNRIIYRGNSDSSGESPDFCCCRFQARSIWTRRCGHALGINLQSEMGDAPGAGVPWTSARNERANSGNPMLIECQSTRSSLRAVRVCYNGSTDMLYVRAYLTFMSVSEPKLGVLCNEKERWKRSFENYHTASKKLLWYVWFLTKVLPYLQHRTIIFITTNIISLNASREILVYRCYNINAQK